MRSKWTLLIGLIFGLMMGWALAYLRLPDFSNGAAFWIGFLACIAAGSFVFSLRALAQQRKSKEKQRVNWLLISVLLVSSGWLAVWVITKVSKDESRELRKRYQQTFIRAELESSAHISELLPIMKQLLDELSKELDQSPDRRPSDEITNRIANLSQSLKPYRLWESDSLSEQYYSPERAQLLITLANLRIDSTAFLKMKQQINFAKADLRGMKLDGLDFRQANLSGAYLRDASLVKTRLDGADLRDADFWGSNLFQVSLCKAQLQRARLAWAELDSAVLDSADLSGVQAANSKWRQARLLDADLKWSDLSTTDFHTAQLEGAYLLGANLRQANLRNANLFRAYIARAVIEDADLVGAELSRAAVHEFDWTKKISMWRVNGAEGIQQTYKVIEDQRVKSKKSLMRIEEG